MQICRNTCMTCCRCKSKWKDYLFSRLSQERINEFELLTKPLTRQLFPKNLPDFANFSEIHRFGRNSSIWAKFVDFGEIRLFRRNSSISAKFVDLGEIRLFGRNSSISAKFVYLGTFQRNSS
jgi:hypothetical protein